MPFDRTRKKRGSCLPLEKIEKLPIRCACWRLACRTFTRDGSIWEDIDLINNPSCLTLNTMRGVLVERANLRRLDPVRGYLDVWESTAITQRSDRADAAGSKINNDLTNTALMITANHL